MTPAPDKLSRTPAGEGSGVVGEWVAPFDQQGITDAVSAIETSALRPIIRNAADEFYNAVLSTAEDYLRENLDHNLKSHLDMLERENARMRTELWEVDRVLNGNWMTHETRIARLRENDGKLIERAKFAEVLRRIAAWTDTECDFDAFSAREVARDALAQAQP